jgi:membrane protease YdiL (CAAX protease family)
VFVKRPSFRFRSSSVLIFVLAAFVAWEINVFGQNIFPSQNLIPFISRMAITLAADLGLIYVSIRLLNKNNLPKEALGLSVTGKTVSDIGWGMLIGVITIALIAGLLFIFVPFHFISGQKSGLEGIKESIAYIPGNTLEEIIFRGFLFILLSQLTDWRLSALILALPFGLLHLPGMGHGTAAVKMVAITACTSFVFSFSFVLFRSMWTAITAHIVMNILLHVITGLGGGGKAVFEPFFDKSWPTSYDPGFIATILSALSVSAILFLIIVRSENKSTVIVKEAR